MRVQLFRLILWAIAFVIVFANAHSLQAQESGLNYQLRSALTSFRQSYDFPGATAAYVLADGSTGAVAVGLDDIELNIAMSTNSRMLAASIGKTFVAATVIALDRAGYLKLDDAISKWLDDRAWFDRLPNSADISIRQLLRHQSGIPDHVFTDNFRQTVSESWKDFGDDFSPEDLVSHILDMPPLFAAGEGWSYSDTGYVLLGMIIEKSAKTSLYEQVTQRFLTPLQLTQTTPSNQASLPNLAAAYTLESNAFGLPRKSTSAPGVMVWNPAFEWAGGGLVSSSKDLAIWGKALFEGQAIDEAYLDDLLASVPINEHAPASRYGAGVGIYLAGPYGAHYGHAGWLPGYVSSLRYYPDYGVSIAFQINSDINLLDGMTAELEEKLVSIVVGQAAL